MALLYFGNGMMDFRTTHFCVVHACIAGEVLLAMI